MAPPSLVVVLGASGYIGGRLVGELLEAGYRVRCAVRSPAKLDAAPWRAQVEVVRADVEEEPVAGLTAALAGAGAVYFLVHTIGSGPDWVERERLGADHVRQAAEAAGVRRIVYLGGLGDDRSPDLSRHLASRHEVGRTLASGSVPVTELRAAVIIGSGSASFEMLRYLVEVLPCMVTPRWVGTRCQPIAVRDVLRYLVQVLQAPGTAGRVLEIGGPDVLTYRQMMAVYAEEAGLRRRLVVPVPVLTPGLSSWWVGLVTPLPRSLARPLVDSLVNEVVVCDDAARQLCPGPLLPYRTAVRLALGRTRAGTVLTRWAGAEQAARVAAPLPTDPHWAGGSELADRRVRTTSSPPGTLYAAACRLGGERGWPGGEWLWQLRGFLDKLAGGPGLRRGRRHPSELHLGEPLDFWRVEALEPGHLVRLRAEMLLPGEAWLEWWIEPGRPGPGPGPGDGGGDGHGAADPAGGDGPVPSTGATITQVARFRPRGLWGRAYWYGVAPFHRFVFPGLLDGVVAEAARVETEAATVAGEGGAGEAAGSLAVPVAPPLSQP